MAKLDRIEGFRFWAHKIIPLVYDESLSYYEFLCKVMAKLNETIELLNKQNEELENFEEEIGKKFEELAEEFEDEMGLKFAELKDQLVSDINDYFALLIPTFSEDVTYLKGDYVYHDERVYELTVPTITGEWDSTKWADVTLTESLASRLRAITDKLSDIDEDIAQLSQSLTTVINHLKYDLVPEYDTHSDYYEGDYVYHENVIYKANQYVTAGEFDSTKWSAVVLATDIATTLRTLKTYVDNTVSTAVTNLRSYVDSAVSTAETELQAYTDNSVTSAKTELRTYVDEQVANLELKKVNMYGKFPRVHDFTDYSHTYEANQVITTIMLVPIKAPHAVTIISCQSVETNSVSFARLVNNITSEEWPNSPDIIRVKPFTIYYFGNIPAGSWRFEFYNDGTNNDPFNELQHVIQHDETTSPQDIYMPYGGLNSAELGYAIAYAEEIASSAKALAQALGLRYDTTVPALQTQVNTLDDAVGTQLNFNNDLVPWFDEDEPVVRNMLRRVDTEINGVRYNGVYRCIHLTAMAGPFDPQYWVLTTVAQEIQNNTTALNGKKISDPMTQAQYDALTTVDPNTLYIIVPT